MQSRSNYLDSGHTFTRMKMDLESAAGKHAEWKVKFRAAITKKEQMDVASICKDNCCELGKWLHAEGKAAHGHVSEFAQVIAKHRDFHVEAGKVASLINWQKYDEAERMLSSPTYSAASTDVVSALLRLKKVISTRDAAKHAA